MNRAASGGLWNRTTWHLDPEKLEIIRLVEQSHLPVRRTLAKIGIPATTFYRWYDRWKSPVAFERKAT
jgi:transposase-like protein